MHVSEHDCLIATTEAAGYMVIDTACQRSCCGEAWCDSQVDVLAEFGLKPMMSTCHETFQFGAGKPKISTRQMTFPAAVGEECFLLGTNIVKASIPFLGSLTTLQELGCVLDFPNQKAHLTHLNRTAKLRLLQDTWPSALWSFPQSPTRVMFGKNLKIMAWMIRR